MILINHTSATIRKKRLIPTSKARWEASRNEFMEKGGMPDRVESFRKINGRKDCPRARPGFVKPIRNVKKKQNLIKCKPSWAETGLAGREKMELDSRKKSRRERMMRSKRFETQKVSEIGRKEAGESRGSPVLWMGIMEDVFQMKVKECEDQERLKI